MKIEHLARKLQDAVFSACQATLRLQSEMDPNLEGAGESSRQGRWPCGWWGPESVSEARSPGSDAGLCTQG